MSDEEKTIPEFFKEITFKSLLKEAELSNWKKKLLEDIWDLKIRDGELRFTGDTITQMIRDKAKIYRDDLERKISTKSNSDEEK